MNGPYGFKIPKNPPTVFRKDKQEERKHKEKKVSSIEIQWEKKFKIIMHHVQKLYATNQLEKFVKNFCINCINS